MIKRGKFWFPEDDNHFNGDNYQVHHRRLSLSHCDNFNTAIDVGAHVGTWAVDLQEFFEKVYAFEPVREHIECLEKTKRPVLSCRTLCFYVEKRLFGCSKTLSNLIPVDYIKKCSNIIRSSILVV